MKRTTGPVFLVSTLLLVVVVVLSWVYRPQPEKPATPQQIAAADTLVLQLKTPGSATLDTSATACGGRTPYCVTSDTTSPEVLLGAVLGQLKDAGASVKSQACVTRTAVQGAARCTSKVRYHGVTVLVNASDTTQFDYPTPSWLSAIVDDPDHTIVASVAALPAWPSLHVAPDAWHVNANPACTTPGAVGCNGYSQTLTVKASPSSARTAELATLKKAGYRIDNATCQQEGTLTEKCSVQASRFRSAGGADPVVVKLTASALDAKSSSVTLVAGLV